MKLAFKAMLIASLAAAPAWADGSWNQVGSQGVVHLVQLSESATSDDVRIAVAETCGMKKPICKVIFWRAPDVAASKLPMTDDQAATIAADWSQNTNTGHRQMLWDCTTFESDGDDCL